MSLVNTQKQCAIGVIPMRSDQAQQALILREKQAEIYFWQELEDFNCDEDYEVHIPIQQSTEKSQVTDSSPKKPSNPKRKQIQKKDSPSHEGRLERSANQQAARYSKESSKNERNNSTKKSSRHHDSSSKSDRYTPYSEKHSSSHSSEGRRNQFKDKKSNNSSNSTHNQRY